MDTNLAQTGDTRRQHPSALPAGRPSGPLHEAPPVPAVRHDLQILQSLRRLIRAADLFSQQLVRQHHITSPQLICLHKIVESDGLTVSALSKAIFLSPSTVVGILDRLERQGLVSRERSAEDRRKVLIHATGAGADVVEQAPSPLQRALEDGLLALTPHQQQTISDSLLTLTRILGLEDLDAAPVYHPGALDETSSYHRPVTDPTGDSPL